MNLIFSDFGGSYETFFPLDKTAATAPIKDWQRQLELYEFWWSHFSGATLEEERKVDVNDGTEKSVELYPLKINTYKMLGLLHASLMWGAQPEGTWLQFTTESLGIDLDITVDQRPSILLGRVLTENLAYKEIRRGGRLFQAFGAVWLACIPDANKVLGSDFRVLPPTSVFPEFNLTTKNKLESVWIMRWVSLSEARSLGWTGNNPDEKLLYKEHWRKDGYRITINNDKTEIVATRGGNKLSGTYDTGGLVPFVLIPRLSMDGMSGTSIVNDIVGLVHEKNLKASDIGDAVNSGSHSVTWTKNTRGLTFNTKDYYHGDSLDLGDDIAGAEEIKVGRLDPHGVPESSLEYLKWLHTQALQATQTAKVVLGEDEGSQRSGETMAARALPTIARIAEYREVWGEGFAVIALLAMTNYNNKVPEDKQIKDIDEYVVRTTWQPVLPRDRQVEATIESLLKAASLRSRRQGITNIGGVQSVAEEERLIEADMKLEAELSVKPNSPGVTVEPKPTLPEEG